MRPPMQRGFQESRASRSSAVSPHSPSMTDSIASPSSSEMTSILPARTMMVQCWLTWKEKCDILYEEYQWQRIWRSYYYDYGKCWGRGEGEVEDWWPTGRTYWRNEEEVTRRKDLGTRWQLFKQKGTTIEPGPAGGDQ